MKKLAMLLGCGMIAFAIGCGDGGSGSSSSGTTPPPAMPDPAKMAEFMKTNPPGATDAAAGEEKKEGDAAAEKKEGDAPAEKKE